MSETYMAEEYGDKEVAMMKKYTLQKDDARQYFLSYIKPRLDRAYKLYIAYNGDRAKEIQKWQNNIFVPYVMAVVETMMPRILDARPEFSVQGRNEDDQARAEKNQNLLDFTWEISRSDTMMEDLTRAAMIAGTGFMQVSWKKDVRSHKFLVSKDLLKKKLTWKEEKRTFYDAPHVEWVDNYSLWYDWRNIKRESKRFWFKRLLMTGEEIKRRYPMYDPKRLELAFKGGPSDINDYASIRYEVKYTHEGTNRGSDYQQGSMGGLNNIYQSSGDDDLKIHEIFEWWRPFEDIFTVMVNDVPILLRGSMPNPYDFKESPFIDVAYLRLPNEFEGVGLPLMLENPQIMLNVIKNQRLDSAILNIHKMWIVNPLANVNKNELIVRPFGIIYTSNTDAVKPVEFSDIKASAYKEEELLKSDMRYTSGVDDFSMGVGGGATSATEVRHLRESTLERVRMFVNHLGDGLSVLMRYWLSMYRQFFTKDMHIRILGEQGVAQFPLITKDDLSGEFDLKAMVLPSIAGKNDIEKKQGMDLFQLLINLPFVDPQKLTSKVLHSWNWSLESLIAAPAAPQPGELPPGAPGESMPGMPGDQLGGMPTNLKQIPSDVASGALSMLGYQGDPNLVASSFGEMASPVNLLNTAGAPPTAAGIPAGKTTNPRGLNRTGKVNTNVNVNQNSNPESALMNRTFSLQR